MAVPSAVRGRCPGSDRNAGVAAADPSSATPVACSPVRLRPTTRVVRRRRTILVGPAARHGAPVSGTATVPGTIPVETGPGRPRLPRDEPKNLVVRGRLWARRCRHGRRSVQTGADTAEGQFASRQIRPRIECGLSPSRGTDVSEQRSTTDTTHVWPDYLPPSDKPAMRTMNSLQLSNETHPDGASRRTAAGIHA